MSFEEDVSKAAFDAFATASTLEGTATASIIDRNVETVDSDGNLRRHVALVHFWKATLPEWDTNDVLVAEAGNFKLDQIEQDDGYIVKISARPVATVVAALQFGDGTDVQFGDGSYAEAA